jgi:hypothetical protein
LIRLEKKNAEIKTKLKEAELKDENELRKIKLEEEEIKKQEEEFKRKEEELKKKERVCNLFISNYFSSELKLINFLIIIAYTMER